MFQVVQLGGQTVMNPWCVVGGVKRCLLSVPCCPLGGQTVMDPWCTYSGWGEKVLLSVPCCPLGGQTVMNPWFMVGGVASAVCDTDEYIM